MAPNELQYVPYESFPSFPIITVFNGDRFSLLISNKYSVSLAHAPFELISQAMEIS